MSMCLGRPARILSLAGAGVVLALAVGFLAFALEVTRTPQHDHGRADGIVVLTGGGARLGEAGRLMQQGFGSRLLISGINPRTQPEDLVRLTGLEQSRFACCVDLGYAAQDTAGNAEETRDWALSHRFRRLIVVTASYHMPRSLTELARAMPDIELLAHPVLPHDFSRTQWSLASLRLLVGEYLKLISSSTKLAMSRLVMVTTWSRPVDLASSPSGASRQ